MGNTKNRRSGGAADGDADGMAARPVGGIAEERRAVGDGDRMALGALAIGLILACMGAQAAKALVEGGAE